MHKKLIYIFILIPSLSWAQIQGVLSYEDAVKIAMMNNFDLRIAKNDAEIAAIENHIGNAGFLPKVDLNANGSLAVNNIKQAFSNGTEVNKNNVVSKNIVGGAYVTYAFFDGFKMFATKEKLNILQEQGDIKVKIQIENVLEQLTLNYYQIVKQQQLITGLRAAMDVSEERIKLANKKLQLGSGSNVELLQAKLDRNAQQSNLLKQKSILKEYKNNLTQLLQSERNSSFSVDTNFVFQSVESMETIQQKIDHSNFPIQFAEKNILGMKQTMIEIKSQTMPKAALTTNYAYGRSQTAAGFSLFNQNLGSTFGLNVNWTIFNGFVVKKQMQAAHIQLQNYLLESDKLKTATYTEANNAYIRWLSDKETLELEEENIKLAEQSLFIMLERMKVGLGNYLETKESESSYEAAITRLVNARYNLKESETRLKKVSGEFVQ